MRSLCCRTSWPRCRASETLCIYHTIAVYQFTAEMKQALDDLLLIASLRRPLFRLSLEGVDDKFPLTLTRYADGAVTARVLAFGGPQGAWIEWAETK